MSDLKHRLAAILAADVAGYSRLMAADDRATVKALDAAREVFRSNIAANHGQVIDMAGDSVLAVFDTAIGAVHAAIAIQRTLATTTAEVPEDRRMRFRIGIHLGDVIQKADGTIYGDGVNIAARLEGLSVAGCICVSESVRFAVKGKVPAAFSDLGEQQVKNIPDPVRVYRVTMDGMDAAAVPSLPAPWQAPVAAESDVPQVPEKPSIAVLPFSNMSGDAEQEFFADGITEDIITELSRISGMLVIARNSTFVFKKQAVDIQEVGRRFGVRHVLEGSVRKAGARVRITAQLIDTASGGHVWAERFDRGLEDIFAVQDEVTQNIVNQLKVKLTKAERSSRGQRGKVNIEAYDLTMRARANHFKFNANAAAEARELLDRAIHVDPTFAPAYAVLGMVHAAEYINGWVQTPGHLERGVELARKSIELDHDEAEAHYSMTMLQLWQRNFDVAEQEARMAISVGPSFAPSYMGHGQVMDFTGRHDIAVESFENASRLDPGNDLLIHLIGRAYFGRGRMPEAEASFKRRLVRNPRSDMTRAYLASIYGATGRIDEARALWDEIIGINPTFTIEHLRRVLPYKDPSWFERLARGLREAALIEAG